MLLDDFMGYRITHLENWADAIIKAGLPTDLDSWMDLAPEVGIDPDDITEYDLNLVDRMLEERARW